MDDLYESSFSCHLMKRKNLNENDMANGRSKPNQIEKIKNWIMAGKWLIHWPKCINRQTETKPDCTKKKNRNSKEMRGKLDRTGTGILNYKVAALRDIVKIIKVINN